MDKVPYPSRYEDKVAMYILYDIKYDSYTEGDSPTEPYLVQNEIEMDINYAHVTQSFEDNLESDNFVQLGIEERVARDNDFDPVWKKMLLLEAFLMRLYKNNPRMLEKFGVNINSNRVVSKARKSKLLPTESKKITGLQLGKKVVNNSIEKLYYQKGMKVSAPMLFIDANTSFTVTKGGTTMRFKNLSASVTINFLTDED